MAKKTSKKTRRFTGRPTNYGEAMTWRCLLRLPKHMAVWIDRESVRQKKPPATIIRALLENMPACPKGPKRWSDIA